MRKFLVLIFALVASIALVSVPSSAATSAPGDVLKITAFGYNAAGPDRTWNRNQEFIDVQNMTDAPVNVYGLVIQDKWAHDVSDNPRGCNSHTVTELPGLEVTGEGSDRELMLPAGHKIRVYSGTGTDMSPTNTQHTVYSDSKCGYNGHYLNNSGDTLYVERDGEVFHSYRYDWSAGYYFIVR